MSFSTIGYRQNTEPFLRLLRARQQTYRRAERAQIAQILLTVALPLAGSIIALLFPAARPAVGMAGFLVTFFDVALLDRYQRQQLRTAARISEQFDCELLEIPWNKFVAGSRVAPEVVEEAARTWKPGDAKLINWYPAAVDKAPMHLARILCQLANLWYDSTLRRRYSTYVMWFVILIAFIELAIGVAANLSMSDLVLSVMSPMAPVVVWSLREMHRQRDTAEAIEAIRSNAEALWDKAKSGGCDDRECALQAREFQNAIFSRRSANPMIFPFLYEIWRPGMEESMERGAEARLAEIT